MAYVHCHDCGWQQDDFWNSSYNPIRFLLTWEADLLDFKRLDEPFTDDAEFLREHGNLTRREVIARELEQHAKNIRNMVFFTSKDLANAVCPKCGAPLDVD